MKLIRMAMGAGFWLAVLGSAWGQQATVELELAYQRGFDISRQHEWLEMLSGVGADRVTIRAARAGDRVHVETTSLGRATVHRVTGLLTAGDQLQLPGQNFSRRDQARIAEWVKKIRDDGPGVALAETHAFGLTAQQLVEVHQALSRPVGFSTQGVSTAEVVRRIAQPLGVPIDIRPSAQRALAEEWPVADELSGLTSGTALAAAVRPLGLVLAPSRPQGEDVRLVLAQLRELPEHWPIGWPIQAVPIRAAPKLFARQDVEITGYPLDATLEALAPLIETPLLIDYNSLARHDIQLDQVRVTLVERQASYYSMLRQLLAQSHPPLRAEIRMDESENPFVWISGPAAR